MSVSNGHSAVTGPAAIDLDRGIRYQLMDAVLRPTYARNFRDQLSYMTSVADGVVAITGRHVWLKKLIARVLRPFQHRQAQFNGQVTERFAELFDLIVTLMHGRAEMLTHVTAEMRERIENLRTELFLELRSQGGTPVQGAMEEARALAILKSMKDAPRLHVGCTAGRREGYLNVDECPGPNVECVTRFDALPTRPGTVAELVANRVFERFPAQDVARRLLPHWVSSLRPGGRLVVVSNDLEAATESLRQGSIEDKDYVRCLYGSQARPFDTFHSAYTPSLLRDLVRDAGLDRVTVTARRQNTDLPVFEFELEAYKAA